MNEKDMYVHTTEVYPPTPRLMTAQHIPKPFGAPSINLCLLAAHMDVFKANGRLQRGC